MSKTSLLDQLRNGMAAIEHVPDLLDIDEVGEVEPGDHVIGMLPDHLKRMNLYHSTVIDEKKPLLEEYDRLGAELTAVGELVISNSTSFVESVDKSRDFFNQPEVRAKAVRLDELHGKLEPLTTLASWVKDTFWAEVRYLFKVPEGHTELFIRSDWSVVSLQDEQGLGLDSLAKIIGGASRRSAQGRTRHPLHS